MLFDAICFRKRLKQAINIYIVIMINAVNNIQAYKRTDNQKEFLTWCKLKEQYNGIKTLRDPHYAAGNAFFLHEQ